MARNKMIITPDVVYLILILCYFLNDLKIHLESCGNDSFEYLIDTTDHSKDHLLIHSSLASPLINVLSCIIPLIIIILVSHVNHCRFDMQNSDMITVIQKLINKKNDQNKRKTGHHHR